MVFGVKLIVAISRPVFYLFLIIQVTSPFIISGQFLCWQLTNVSVTSIHWCTFGVSRWLGNSNIPQTKVFKSLPEIYQINIIVQNSCNKLFLPWAFLAVLCPFGACCTVKNLWAIYLIQLFLVCRRM